MIYITGDTHRDFYRLHSIGKNNDNMIIILGDAGINYCLNKEDSKIKKHLNDMNIKLFCIQGNHEERPENISSYKEADMFGGKVFIEDEYPNLIFAKNGKLYTIDYKSVLVIGGAYSVDKDYRLVYGHRWFKDEQLSKLEKEQILNKYSGKHIDIILSHTCPLKYEPTEVFMKGLDQSKVDKSMEIFLNKIEENIDYGKWYCGHFHTEKQCYPKYNRNGYEVIRDVYSQDEVIKEEVVCLKCHSKDISVIKGDRFRIDGTDFIGITCNNCKKVYGFYDVNYKPNCPKEL